MTAESPYPELKKTHTMARNGRPWRDYKPAPAATVWSVIQAGNTYWMLVAALDLGLFEAFAAGTTRTTDSLASDLNVSAPHLGHLLDAMVTLGFLDQLDDQYELTETAERYLRSDGAAPMADLVRVSPGPLENWINLADTIRNGKVSTPIENDIAGFYGPLVQASFPTQLRVASRLGLKLGWSRLQGLRVLDLGAGCAPWAIGLLEQVPDSTAVINDLPEIIGLAESKIEERDLSDRCEFRAGNFHDINIESDAYDVVVLGHLCRTEGPELAQGLIARAVSALRPGGMLLLADYFADNERKLNAFGVQMGMTMLANTERGGLLTHEQVHTWLAEQSLEAIRLLEPIGFNLVYVATRR